MSNNIKIMANRQDIVAIADAVRSKTGTTSEMTLEGIASRINRMSASGGMELPELTNEGTASDMLSGKQLIDQEGNIVTGNIPNNGVIDKIFDGIDTKSATIPAGYTSGGIVSLTNDIDNEVSSQEDLISQITLALANKTAGSGSGGGITLPSLSNPATEDEVFLNQEYIDENGEKKTGTFTIDNELTQQDNLITQIQTALEGKTSGIDLPVLSNPATAKNLENGYQLIDGAGNIVTGTHICESGGSGDGLYLIKIYNATPNNLLVNGVHCAPDDITNVHAPAFMLTIMTDLSSLLYYGYTTAYEDDNGELIEEHNSGMIEMVQHPWGFYLGMAPDCPDVGGVMTIAEEEV